MATSSIFFGVFTVLVVTSSAAPNNNKLVLKIPDECKKGGFCSIRPEGYDAIEEKINSLLPSFLIVNVVDRIGEAHIPETDPDNCPSEIVSASEPPFTFREHENATKVDVIVQTKLFPQRFEYVKCSYTKIKREALNNTNQQCFTSLDKARFLSFTCQEVYASRTLLIYDPEENKIKAKSYPISVCCSCQVQNKLDVENNLD